jgi:hypothetical protein
MSYISLAQDNNQLEAKIKITKSETALKIYATAKNNTNDKLKNLTYEIHSFSRSTSKNLSNSTQKGVFTISPKETKVLSMQWLNLKKDISVNIYLYIKRKDLVIVQDSISIKQPNNYSDNIISTKDSPFIQRNIIITNNTISANGNNFCNYLFQIFQSKYIYPFSVKVTEKKKKNGKGSEIHIFVNEDEFVYKFRTLNRKSYLYAAAQESYKKLKKHHLDNMLLVKNSD